MSYIINQILDMLKANGPMTRAELYRGLEYGVTISTVLSRMSKQQKRFPKRIYICGWTRDDEFDRCYLRPIYALGDLPDAPKPKRFSGAERSKVYRERLRSRMAMNSVFNISKTMKQIKKENNGDARAGN